MDKKEIVETLKERNRAVRAGVGNPFTVEELKGFVKEASVKLEDGAEVVLLYSGALFPDKSGKNIYAFEVAGNISDKNAKIGIIDKTDAFGVLENELFLKALKKAVKIEKLNLNDVLEGSINPDGTRKPDGINDMISKRFVIENSDKPFFTITPFANSQRVYAQTEFPHVLEFEGDLVQEMPRDILSRLSRSHPDGHEASRAVVDAKSFEQTAKLKISVDENGILQGVDTTEFWPEKYAHLRSPMPSHIHLDHDVKHIDLVSSYSKIDPESAEMKRLHKGADISKEVLKDGAKFPTLTKLGKNSGTVGGFAIGGLTSAFTLVAGGSKAEAAEVFYETAVPYGETQIDIAKGDAKAAARSATIETSSNVGALGGMAVGAAIGSAVPVIGTVAGGVVGSIVGGLSAAGATEYVADHWDKAKEWLRVDESVKLDLQTAFRKLPNKARDDMPPEVAALVEVKASKTLFERQFNELKEHGGLDEVQGYIEKNHLQLESDMPSVSGFANRPSQSYKPIANSVSF